MPTYYFYLFSDEERQCDANIAHLVGSSLATIYVEDERVHIKSFDRDTGLILFETPKRYFYFTLVVKIARKRMEQKEKRELAPCRKEVNEDEKRGEI